jgi:hypothetical protein
MLVSGLVAAIALAAPGSARPASAADDAATVNGDAISVDDFETVAEELGAAGMTPAITDSTVTADAGRQILTVMILNSVREQFLAERGEPLTDEELATQIDAATSQAPDLTGLGRDVLATHFAYGERFAQIEAPTEAELAASYSASPASVGVICLNVISIVGDADDAADALREGTSPREVVAEAGNGSRVQDECFSLGELALSVPGLFRDLIELGSGELLDPIETSSGHQILQIAAFDDIASELVGYFADPPVSPSTGQAQTAGDLLLAGYVLTADVSVNPRYGRWDAATVSIVPLGQP